MLYHISFLILLIIFALLRANIVLKETMRKRSSFKQLAASPRHATHDVTISVTQKNINKLKEIVDERSNPNSPLYSKWLTKDQVGKMVHNRVAVKEIKKWLASINTTLIWESLHSEYLRVTAPIATWEFALKTKFYQWQDTHKDADKNNEIYHRSEAYYIPSHLAEHIQAVFNTVQLPLLIHKNEVLQSWSLDTTVVSGNSDPDTLNAVYGITSNSGKLLIKNKVSIVYQ